MPLNIKSPEADRLARELAHATGESLTVAVTRALAERLERCQRPRVSARRLILEEVRARVSALPELNDRSHRSDDELLGYGADGTFE